ncbi:MAG: nucleotide sugar dehydrogenase [Candidatus Eisenbacteria bacterium]|nr:nucleotide sugar dehydrogenase [Candidatus Eisenbacteria bacterium]
MTLKERIETKRARVGVIGLGYVGLPLAVEFAKAGFTVVGIDTDREKVEAIHAGRSYVGDVSSEDLARAVNGGAFTATTAYDAIAELDSVNICVPTPLRKTGDPDISYIHAAVHEIQSRLKPGMLVILESTTYPGTTEEVILPILSAEGLEVGKDFYLAFSPERVDPGNKRFLTRNIPKVVGGVTPACTELAMSLYRACLEQVIPVSSTKVAEMVKLLENTFRSVNIGLVNEIALMSRELGVNVWEVIDAAATKPFGFMPFYPGPGLGGHCIPIDPFYLSWKARQYGFEARFIELAGQINGYMPRFVVDRIADALNGREKSLRGSRILALGVTYKPDIDDIRESPAIDVIEQLKKKGALVEACDHHLRPADRDLVGCPIREYSLEALREADCAVILTNHSDFDYKTILKESAEIVDTRNALKGFSSKKIHLL